MNSLIKADGSLFLFNHSPTGSGKTISWLKPALDDKMKVIAVYPTNALVIDQKKQVDSAIERFGYDPRDYHVQAITSDLLVKEKELYPDEIGLRKGQLLNRSHTQRARTWADTAHKSRYSNARFKRCLLRAQYSRGGPERGYDSSRRVPSGLRQAERHAAFHDA